jgi:hypothetical protein
MAQWDKLSCRDRLEQIHGDLSRKELAVLTAFLQQMGGATFERMGFLNALHWWVLGSHTPTGLNDIALHTRLRCGNSHLHQQIFGHAKSTGKLSYRFNFAVKHVKDSDGVVTVTSREGHSWTGKHVICTIPLNVLGSVEFDPPLSPGKKEATTEGQVNLCNKVHVDVDGPDYLSWSSFCSPGKGFVCSLSDCLTPAENTHLVAFGPDPAAPNGIMLKDIEAVKTAFLETLPVKKRDEVILSRIVSTPLPKESRRESTTNQLYRYHTIGTMMNLPKAHGATCLPTS